MNKERGNIEVKNISVKEGKNDQIIGPENQEDIPMEAKSERISYKSIVGKAHENNPYLD